MHRLRLVLLIAAVACLVSAVTSEYGVQTGEVVTTAAQLNACLTAGRDCYQSVTITDTFTEADPTENRNTILLPNSFQNTWACAPGVEYRVNNAYAPGGVPTMVDTADWNAIRLVGPAALESTLNAKPHTLRIKCPIVEYFNGSEGGALGTVELLKIVSSNTAGETDKAGLVILDEGQVRGHSVGTSSVGFTFNPLGSFGGQITDNSWVEAAIGADFKGDCGSCVTGVQFGVYNSTLRSGNGVCDNDSSNTGAPCTTGTVCAGSGTAGTITSFADAGDPPITVNSTAHGLSNSDAITITGTTEHNGAWTVANSATDSFTIADALDADTGTGAWYRTAACVLPNATGSLKQDGGGTLTVSDSTLLGVVEISGANATGPRTHLFTNTLFEGPGLQPGGQQALFLINDEHHIMIQNGRVGPDWPVLNNAEMFIFRGGSLTANMSFDSCDLALWVSGGTTSAQYLVNATTDALAIEHIALTVRGPKGCRPNGLIHPSALAVLENDETDGFIDGGPELGRIDFSLGLSANPPGTETRVICADVALDNSQTTYLQWDDCTTPAAEGDAEGAWQVASDWPTKILGLDVDIDEEPGSGNNWEFIVRAGGTGALGDTTADCFVTNNQGTRCLTEVGAADEDDFLTVKIVPSSTPDCTVCTGNFVLRLSETYE